MPLGATSAPLASMAGAAGADMLAQPLAMIMVAAEAARARVLTYMRAPEVMQGRKPPVIEVDGLAASFIPPCFC
jgi:hypothetical protein